MPKLQLSAQAVLTALCEPGKRKTDYWDTITTGFVLEVRSGGGKTYALRFIDEAGRQRQHKIGAYADITFDQARKAAKRLRSEVVLGGNPAADKEVRKAIPTYATLAAQHIAYAKTYQRRPGNTEAVLRLHIVPRWGKLRLDEIKTQDISRWFAEKAEEGLAPATVEKIRVTFSRSLELARQWGLPGAEINPVRNVPRRRFSNARERFLSAKEADRLFAALNASDNPQLRSIVALLLLTGARKTELLTAQWQHVDLERKAWFIPTTKTGKPRHVPLSQAAADIIKQLLRFDDCPWLLPNPVTLKPYVTLKRAWDTARAAAGLPGLRIHDLRHSAASFMINAGVDLFAVGKVLGHTDHKSTMRYSHLANDTLMRAVEAGAAGLTVGWAAPVV
ncbi:tyrosine-type recombinase/integrase [Sphingosinicellaceae bacterium]|nr:tyrosine-type recombinase/integrase [Sphingosinicellaceae bacterium]